MAELRRAVAETVRSSFLGDRPPKSDRAIGRLVDVDGDRRLVSTALLPDGRTVGITRDEAERHADIAEVAVAVDGAQGVEMARTERPDLVLMDLSLPVIDGWEATRRIRGNDATRRIPVIALTAHAMAGDREKAMEAGCDDYDTKPVEITRLLGKITALLNPTAG